MELVQIIARLYLLLICCACVFYQGGRSDLLSSTAHLEDVVKTEERLSNFLEKFIEAERIRITTLREILRKRKRLYTSKRNFANSNSDDTLKRFVYGWSFVDDWSLVLREVTSPTHPQRTDFLDSLKEKKASLPSEDDFQGSRKAILRLQQVYNLSAAAFVRGHVINNGQTYSAMANMSAVDAFLVGRSAYGSGAWKRTKDWMESVLRLMGNRQVCQNIGSRVEQKEVLNHLAFVEFKLGNWNQSLQTYQRMKKLDPNDTQISINIEYVQESINEYDPYAEKEVISEFLQENVHKIYANLCKGSHPKERDITTPQLKCSYHNEKTTLLLKPVAMEILSVEPKIVMFHDVISDKESEELIKLATPWLTRATVNNIKTGEIELADYRISKHAWFKDEDAEVIRRISRRIEDLTGLSAKTGEELQINNYGLGGHYEPHYDQSRNMSNSPLAELGVGNRIATFMLYLSDVEAGGATVFLKAGIRTLPKKGSGVFWYNLLRSGEADWQTLHAGCPVLVGSKWVANKWLHERGQEFLRPCGLTPDEK